MFRETVFKAKDLSCVYEPLLLPDFQEVSENKQKYAESFAIQYKNTDPFTAQVMAESYGTKGYVIQNPPAKPLTRRKWTIFMICLIRNLSSYV